VTCAWPQVIKVAYKCGPFTHTVDIQYLVYVNIFLVCEVRIGSTPAHTATLTSFFVFLGNPPLLLLSSPHSYSLLSGTSCRSWRGNSRRSTPWTPARNPPLWRGRSAPPSNWTSRRSFPRQRWARAARLSPAAASHTLDVLWERRPQRRVRRRWSLSRQLASYLVCLFLDC